MDKELIEDGREIHSWYVPADEILPKSMKNPYGTTMGTLLPGDIRGLNDHGTMMASAAAGITLGIAPYANLYLVKRVGDYMDSNGRAWTGATDATMKATFDYVLQQVRHQWQNGNTANIVSWSGGKESLFFSKTEFNPLN